MAVNHEASGRIFHPKSKRYTVPFDLLASIASSRVIPLSSISHPSPYSSRRDALGQRSGVLIFLRLGDPKHAAAISLVGDGDDLPRRQGPAGGLLIHSCHIGGLIYVADDFQLPHLRFSQHHVIVISFPLCETGIALVPNDLLYLR